MLGGPEFQSETDMSQYKSDLLRLLDSRGYIHQLTDAEGLDALAAKQIVPAYIGFDATAPSLHVGSLVQIMMLRRLQQAGHKPVVLMGGGTTRIGDPTGRDESRKMLSDETIEANIASIKTIFARFLKFGDGPTDAIMVNNHDWLGKLGYIEMLQKVGTHFTVNRMLSFDSVKLRLERDQPMTFLEFNYMILQGYDFRHLSKAMDVRLQMGGSDQWGNIVNGMELGRRMDGAQPACRQPGPDHDAAPPATDGAQADRADGRRDDADRRSDRARRKPQDADRCDDRREHRVDLQHL